MYIAHSSPNEIDPPHSLQAHTESVGKLTVDFSKCFDPFAMAQVAAIMHDQGKKSEAFRTYIESPNKVRGKVKHAAGGAIALNNLQNQNPLIIDLTSLIVLGHHAGLSNLRHLNTKLRKAPKELKEIGSLVQEEQKQAAALLEGSKKNIDSIPKTIDLHWYLSTLTRLCFSALIDADWLDTEHYFNKTKSNLRTYEPPEMSTFLPKLDKHMEKLVEKPIPAFLKTIRNHVYEAATNAAFTNESFFTLHAPTGSGKTLASLSFALHHAIENRKQRIIFALPLTNVTEQTSELYRSILGDNHVIEHHSQVELEDESEMMNKKRLAAENWDRPFIITTTVQLFESLFSNRTSKARKLHRIANSIIVLDEYQKLPLHVLKPILSMLKVLREQFQVTVLFMSATPLALEQSKALPNVGTPTEILEQSSDLFKQMTRVEYQQLKQPLTRNELVAKMREHSSVLCIVNTRKDAQQIFESMKKCKNGWDRIYHLSSTMCSDHRLRVIQEIKKLQENLNNRESIAVVSTQTLEAGIDLNFPAVYRMYAPFDSIIQAAGRCNREAEREKGNVYLFDLVNSNAPEPFYAQSIELTRHFLKRNGLFALQEPEACISCFRKIYSNAGENGLDVHQIDGENLFQFEQVANDFQMIDTENSVSVLCLNYPGFPYEVYQQQENSRRWFRKMQAYMIQLHEQAKDIKLINGIYVWDGKYDPDIGYPL